MATNSIICRACGNKIVGLRYTHSGNTYCYVCYQKLRQDLLAQEQQKQELYEYIKGLFQISELSQETMSIIGRELESGKKIRGIELTLKYYFEIEGHNPTSINSLPFVIRDQYDAAKEYFAKVKEIKERNAGVDLNVATTVIKLNPKALDPRRPKFDYKMEDL